MLGTRANLWFDKVFLKDLQAEKHSNSLKLDGVVCVVLMV